MTKTPAPAATSPAQSQPLPPPLADGNLLQILVSGDAAGGAVNGGPLPSFAVLVDGVQVGATHDVSAKHAKGDWQIVEVTLPDGLELTGTLGISYVNDWSAARGGRDRNLYVDEIRLGQLLLDAEDGRLIGVDGKFSAGQQALKHEGILEFDLDGHAGEPPPERALKLVVSGDAAGGTAHDGPYAKLAVLVDGELLEGAMSVTADHAAGEWQTILVDLGRDAADVGSVGVRYANDWASSNPQTPVDDGEDRNLYIREIEVEGTVLTPEEGILTGANGIAHQGSGDLFNAGTLSFDLDALIHQPPPVETG